MKKISFVLLASLFMAGAVSAQTTENGIVMTHDANVASRIEQHARDIQSQPQSPVAEHDTRAVRERAPHKHAHRHHKAHPAQPASSPAGK